MEIIGGAGKWRICNSLIAETLCIRLCKHIPPPLLHHLYSASDTVPCTELAINNGFMNKKKKKPHPFLARIRKSSEKRSEDRREANHI